jgi:hypothetical protein
MGFLSPKLPPFNVHFWFWGRRAERIKPMCQHWGEHGLGAPWGLSLLYLVKIVCYLAGGLAFIITTPGIGQLTDIGVWWTDPVVYQKAVIWSLLFEVLGFGCGFGPLTLRFLPPVGGLLHWLRPGTIRLPAWPGRIPFTEGTRRGVVDVALYVALLASAVWPLVSPATRLGLGVDGLVTMLEPSRLLPLAVLLPLLGLRDKTIFLAARAEYYWIIMLAFFMPFLDMILTIKIMVVLVWWAASVSKMNKMFPSAVAAMFSDAPMRPKWMRRWMFRAFPNDMRPSTSVSAIAYFGVFVELTVPLVLLISTDPWVTLCAMALMVLFHLNILLALPLGAPMEWNVFIIFSTCYLFNGHFADNLSNAPHPLAPALLALPMLAVAIWGNLRPDQVSFLLAMRYYTGNWATSMWAVQRSAVLKMDRHVTKSSSFSKQQLKQLYGEQVAEVVMHKIYTWRALHHHGRALFGLLPRVAGPEHEQAIVVDGEMVAGMLLGWDFADGHLHNEQLIAALQERCHFEPGEVRVVVLESAPFGSDRQEYRLVDAATGVFERGYVRVRDMLDRQPWEIDDLPAYVLRRRIDMPGDELVDEPSDDALTPVNAAPISTAPVNAAPEPERAELVPADETLVTQPATSVRSWDNAPEPVRPRAALHLLSVRSSQPSRRHVTDDHQLTSVPRLPEPKSKTGQDRQLRHAGTG